LLDYLTSQQVLVNPLLVAGITLNWSGRTYRVDVRPLVEGRHFNGSLDDLRSLASTVAACHKALVAFPQADAIRASAVSRYNRFAEALDLIATAVHRQDFSLFAEQQDWAFEHRNWLAEMVEQFTPHFDRYPGAQCLHGQIHPGNVLFRYTDGAAVLVDFEEALYTFAPPAFDLAYLVQRFCLRDTPTPEIMHQRLDILSAHYGAISPLADMMRQLAWYSMVAIVECRVYQNIAVTASEFNKFVRLEGQAQALVGVV
jgi:Ser/Thr protein kinase RdoA (MazF antagonist)